MLRTLKIPPPIKGIEPRRKGRAAAHDQVVRRRSIIPRHRFAVRLTLFVGVVLSGCGFVHDEHLVGPYYLTAVDIDDQMSLGYALDDRSRVGRIDETVFAVGWNDRYIVAKQHPKNDRRVTNYFFWRWRVTARTPIRA